MRPKSFITLKSSMSFRRKRFRRHTFDRHTFDRHTFDRHTFDRHTFDRHTFDRHSVLTDKALTHSVGRQILDYKAILFCSYVDQMFSIKCCRSNVVDQFIFDKMTSSPSKFQQFYSLLGYDWDQQRGGGGDLNGN